MEAISGQRQKLEEMLAAITNDLSKAITTAMETSKNDPLAEMEANIYTWACESIIKIKQVTGLTKHTEDAKI